IETPVASRHFAWVRRGHFIFLERLSVAPHRDGSRMDFSRRLHGDLRRALELALRPASARFAHSARKTRRRTRGRLAKIESEIRRRTWRSYSARCFSNRAGLTRARIALAELDQQSAARVSSRGGVGRARMPAQHRVLRLGLEHARHRVTSP